MCNIGIDYTEEADLKEIECSDDSAASIIEKLNSENWKDQFYGIDDLRSLYKHHPKEFEAYLPKFKELIKEGCENLRSSICRNMLTLVVEVYSTEKNLAQKDENGDTTPYAEFSAELLPVVSKKLADDKVFLSSKAKTAIELIAKHCISREITEAFCELSQSKSLVIATEANNALRINSINMDSSHWREKDNVEKLLKLLSEDIGKFVL